MHNTAAPSAEFYSCYIALLEARKPFLGRSFSNRVISIDGINIFGGLYSFGAFIELVK
jgi:hypothetical protein